MLNSAKDVKAVTEAALSILCSEGLTEANAIAINTIIRLKLGFY